MRKVLFLAIFAVMSLAMAAQTLVYTPQLKIPVDEAVNQMPDVTLSWYAVTGSLNLQYQLQVDTSMNFDSPLLIDHNQTLITGFQCSNLLFNTTYYWRVRAIDGATSPWSEVWSFTVFNMVELSKPTNNDDGQDPNVNLEWKTKVGTVNLSGVTFFNYQADTSMNFDSPLLIEGTVAGDIYAGPTNRLLFGTNYYWRVQAGHTMDLSAWTEPFMFTVLDEVTLSSPNDNATNQMLDATLKWKIVGGILNYEFEIASDENFTTLVYTGETNLLEVNADFLMFGNDYWWRVRARHQTDTTTWGAPRKFTSINTVILKSPSDEQVNVAVTPDMLWNAQTGITGYQLQIAKDMAFTDIFYDVKPDATEASTKVTRKMAYNTMYYWKMRAFSDGGALADTTDWSGIWKFTTGNATGIGEQQAGAFSIYPNPASENAFIRITSKEITEARYLVVDLLGKTVLEQTFTLNMGENIQPLNLETLRKGIYVVRLTVNGETVNQKLVVN